MRPRGTLMKTTLLVRRPAAGVVERARPTRPRFATWRTLTAHPARRSFAAAAALFMPLTRGTLQPRVGVLIWVLGAVSVRAGSVGGALAGATVENATGTPNAAALAPGAKSP